MDTDVKVELSAELFLLKKQIINVKAAEVTVLSQNQQDYISLTDMVKKFGDESILYNWLRNRNTIEFLGIWEQLHNPSFKPLEFERFKSKAGLNTLGTPDGEGHEKRRQNN